MPYRHEHGESVCAEPAVRTSPSSGAVPRPPLPRNQGSRAEQRVIARLHRLLVDKSGERCVVCSAIQRLEVHHDGNPSHNELSNLEEFPSNEA